MPKPKILVVDDDHNVVQIIAVNLRYEGMDVLEAYDGHQALESVAQEKPDLILLDVMMPGIDGIQVCRQLRKDPYSADIPIIMLTAKTMDEDMLAGWEAGADDYLTKPFNPLGLTQRVKIRLQERGIQTYPSSGALEDS
ncbi:MAG: response regulator [Chloroflexi bacterium]|nr:response regulator [Chloroflexota bacterium]MBU1746687.1 response regulator [Chloroflexota bacterium]MBU1878333.1 response regulator [Chloroflexota bacterium]